MQTRDWTKEGIWGTIAGEFSIGENGVIAAADTEQAGRRAFLVLVGLGLAGVGVVWPQQQARADTAPVCIVNGTDGDHYFVAEASDGARKAAILRPGERLCSPGAGGGRAVVAVFDDADAIEGCSRLTQEGRTETLTAYADFDRCAWSDR